MVLNFNQITSLQSQPEQIRNICIMAHVDHGKTTLSDSLLASNGIISTKLAGKVRYLDSREDEQARGITMECSEISLFFQLNEAKYLINLIDSPGHIDFSSEVSSASRLCDGAIILVDVVEGICSQTLSVLRQAFNEHIKPVLVLNKIDRLVIEWKLTPTEAYKHMNTILESVNVIVSSLYTDLIADSVDHNENLDSYFSPELGNVIFSSAIDGWAFSIEDFAKIYATKLNISAHKLLKYLWGSHYFDIKTKLVYSGNKEKTSNLKPMFVQFILDNLWAVYDATMINFSLEKVEKIISKLDLKILPREMKSKDKRGLVVTLLSQWLPLASTILVSCIKILPSPIEAQANKIKLIWRHPTPSNSDVERIKNSASLCENGSDVIAYVAKSLFFDKKSLPQSRRIQLTADEMRAMRTNIFENKQPIKEIIQNIDSLELEDDICREVLIGIAGIFSGTIKVGQTLYLMNPKYDPLKPDLNCIEIVVEKLYLVMGRDLYSLEEVPPGNIFAIGGLDAVLLKSGTLSTTKKSPNLGLVKNQPLPILRVAIEPMHIVDMQKLEYGLKLLNQSDPCVEVIFQETGERIIVTAGELHLERCLVDLRTRFSKIEIQTSEPIVPFRETIAYHKSDTDSIFTCQVANNSFSTSISCFPVSQDVLNLIDQNLHLVSEFVNNKDLQTRPIELITKESADSNKIGSISELIIQLEKQLSVSSMSNNYNILAFGPRRSGLNVLVNNTKYKFNGFSNYEKENIVFEELGINLNDIEENVNNAFQLFTQSGPLCSEPLLGVCVVLEDFRILSNDSRPQGNQLISVFREGMKQAFQKWSPRLMLATYCCNIQATSDVLGKVYSMVSKRKGIIQSEVMVESSTIFTINALIPVVESWGFCDQIRSSTSGDAIPQLVFAGFKLLDQDPFWTPSSKEEKEDLGDVAERENLARKYLNMVRKRKGLFVEEKTINAEKQRTLKK